MISLMAFRLVEAYLLVLMSLIPLIFVYGLLLIKHQSNTWTNHLHKLLVVSMLVGPIAFAVASSFDSGGSELAAVNQYSTGQKVEQHDHLSVSVASIQSSALKDQSDRLESTKTVVGAIFSAIFILLPWLSFVGITLFVFTLSYQYLKLRRLRQASEEISPLGGVNLFILPVVNSPFSTQIFQKSIFLPLGLDKAISDVVIKHELNHFQRHHHLWQLADSALAFVFWFNPLSHMLRKQGELFRELECDELTIKSIDKFHYGKVLVQLAEALSKPQKPHLLGLQLIEKNQLNRRINNILGYKSTAKRPLLKTALLVIVALGLSSCFFYEQSSSKEFEAQVLENIIKTLKDQQDSGKTIAIDKAPQHLIDLLLFREDKRYYDHSGVDWASMTRVAYQLASKKISNSQQGSPGGGSTISMQVAKNFAIDNSERNIDYKLRQMRAAKIIEDHFSKNEILSIYLSGVYMGNDTWGIKQASTFYFGKPYSALNLEESALLVQMLKAPSLLNPAQHPEKARQAQNRLLQNFLAVDGD